MTNLAEMHGNRLATAMLNRLSELGYEVRESGDYAKLEAEAHSLREEFAALRARVVVTPEPLARGFFHPIPEEDDYEFHDERFINGDCEQCIPAVIVRSDELARLNGKSVSEGLLRQLYHGLDEFWMENTGKQATEELRALLGEGKEHE